MKNIFLVLLPALVISCGQDDKDSKPETEVVKSDATTREVATEEKPVEQKTFDYPVVYKNWEMGNHENTRLVLKMYKAWDSRSIDDMKMLIADTLTLELPDGVRRSAEKDKMIGYLIKQRKKIRSTANEILAAYPIINTENNDEWVSVLTYNKWRYTDGVRDSMLYQDLWKIRNGKIIQMISLEQSPSRQGLKRIETLVDQ